MNLGPIILYCVLPAVALVYPLVVADEVRKRAGLAAGLLTFIVLAPMTFILSVVAIWFAMMTVIILTGNLAI